MSALGQTPDKSEVGVRDAVHTPIVCVTSSNNLYQGDSVRFTDMTYTEVVICDTLLRQAIVDPFGSTVIEKGQPVWVLLVPNATKNLRHHYDITLSCPTLCENTKVKDITKLVVDTPSMTEIVSLKAQIKELENRMLVLTYENADLRSELNSPEDTCKGCY